jgi:GNAT superfamily N-acetyltransferase
MSDDPQQPRATAATTSAIMVAPLAEHELDDADRVTRLAFGTFLGLPDPLAFMGDANYTHTRYRADPSAAFGARIDGELVGSVFATHWGSVGFFGPLTTHPRLWDQGIASRLLGPVMERFDAWNTTMAGLYTFANSPKHIGLYQKFGFSPRFLTAIMSKPIGPRTSAPAPKFTCFGDALESERERLLADCRELTSSVYDGLDVGVEIRAVAAQGLGDTVLLRDATDDARLAGIAVCHCGTGSEAGSGTCYVKFGAARPGAQAAEDFARLLDACEMLAAARGLSRLVAGVNTARHEAYHAMRAKEMRVDMYGIAMHRRNEVGYNRPGVYLIDDWR